MATGQAHARAGWPRCWPRSSPACWPRPPRPRSRTRSRSGQRRWYQPHRAGLAHHRPGDHRRWHGGWQVAPIAAGAARAAVPAASAIADPAGHDDRRAVRAM